MKPTILMIFLALALATQGKAADAADTPQQVRDRYSEWVKLRKTAAEEKAQWAEDKALVQDRITVLQREKESLQSVIAEAAENTDAAQKARTKLLERRDADLDSVGVLEKKIPGYEAQVLELVRHFPEPLVEEIRPLLNRIPKPGEKTRQTAAQRLQNVVGILTQMDKFNQGVTLCSEIKDIGGGRDVEVRTLYLGLGIAYFVDKNSEYAGYGEPAEDGWKWTVDATIAESVSGLIGTYENASKASFVNIPVKIN